MTFSASFAAEAADHFNREANSLIASLKPISTHRQSTIPSGSRAHLPIAAQFNSDDIRGPIRVSYEDWLGRLQGVEFYGVGIHEILSPEAAPALEQLTDNVTRHRNLRACCSAEYVRIHLIEWIRRRRLGESSEPSWISDLLGSLARDVVERRMLVPVQGIHIVDRFNLGRVVFDFFTESSIADMTDFLPEGTPEIGEFKEKLKKPYRGRVYARYECVAERTHAEQFAIYHTEEALEILRMFELAAVDIRARSVVGRMGQGAPLERHTFEVTSTGKLFLSRGLERDGCIDFHIDSELLSLIQNSPIFIASNLLQKEKLSDLENKSLEALSHFAHGVQSHAPQDRLVHALANRCC